MFRKVLIANRGVVSCRVARTLRRMGVASVAVHSDVDRHAMHVGVADEAYCIGGAQAGDSYLSIRKVISAARQCGAEAIHPGYGFLAENAAFATACAEAGIVFVGPTPTQIASFGLKHEARAVAERAGVPLAPGTGILPDLEAAIRAARELGYPVMLKSTAGGGGIGLQRCNSQVDLEALFMRVTQQAASSFGNGAVFLERFVARGRHVEVQIFGDGEGRVLVLGDRDCSAQRRNQKVIEETPAPNLPIAIREMLHRSAQKLGEAVSYANAGTVEFIYDVDARAAYFLEVNTRLQVEHGVTEAVLGIDLVEWMLRQAAGEPLPELPVAPGGHAIQARLYAEDPGNGFRPAAGWLTSVKFPKDVRIDACISAGTEVSPFYDPMLAVVITRGASREDAIERLGEALAATELDGIETNLDYLRHLLSAGVLSAGLTTDTLARTPYKPIQIVVVTPGTQTTIQDLPGRIGYWNVGVPPSGAMDDLSFRLVNEAVGNPGGAAGLEMVLSGPSLRFDTDVIVCLGGAELPATLDGEAVPYWEPACVRKGSILSIGLGAPLGSRTYLAVRGGLVVPDYLGSKSTFTLGRFGGHRGRTLVAGDVLRIGTAATGPAIPVEQVRRPVLTSEWVIGVIDGPHGAPDFFTLADIEVLYSARWKVHYNSSRTGVRLIGPRPSWARKDCGEAGLHPSNIHDNAYAIGAVDFTGDMPVILGPDGPSLGGFVCPVTIVGSELWKVGQLRAGDTVRFKRLQAPSVARLASKEMECASAGLNPSILAIVQATAAKPSMTFRRAGDCNLLVEYGDPVLDLELRIRVHLLASTMEQARLPGVIDLTPGIRSLQVHFDPSVIHLTDVLREVIETEATLPTSDTLAIPSRLIRLPLSWDDPSTRLAIERYTKTVRPDAPWCPSNIEFIRRINGLGSVDEVKQTVFEAEYLVLGLGDVYLGAPVATPIDPRHRLVTTKYNPARTWTPENAVGIGGAYLCVYGMEGPGGYQFVGRTCQVWNSHRVTTEFEEGSPWLLRQFDRISFYEVSAEELARFRDDFPYGKVSLEITESEFRLADYRQFLSRNADGINNFRKRREVAFEAERQSWQDGTQAAYDDPDIGNDPVSTAQGAGQPGLITSPLAAGVWKLLVAVGDVVLTGQALLVLEAMKVEIAMVSPNAGIVTSVVCKEGQVVEMGQGLIVVE